MSSKSLSDVIPGGIDLGRLAETYVNMKRRRMSAAISEGTDNVSQVEANDMIRQMENTVIAEMGDELPDKAKPVLRAYAQQAILNKLTEGWEDE